MTKRTVIGIPEKHTTCWTILWYNNNLTMKSLWNVCILKWWNIIPKWEWRSYRCSIILIDCLWDMTKQRVRKIMVKSAATNKTREEKYITKQPPLNVFYHLIVLDALSLICWWHYQLRLMITVQLSLIWLLTRCWRCQIR